VFRSLEEKQIQAIAALQVEALRSRLAAQEIGLDVSAEALAHLAEAGFDPVYGARPLKRAIQRLLQNPLAERILQGEFVEGDRVLVSADGRGGLTFSKQ
jgi:ATP-dependent Clp protease ATP-binding subunit ClpB